MIDPTFACRPRELHDGTRDIYLRLRGGEMWLSIDDATELHASLEAAAIRALDSTPLQPPRPTHVHPSTSGDPLDRL